MSHGHPCSDGWVHPRAGRSGPRVDRDTRSNGGFVQGYGASGHVPAERRGVPPGVADRIPGTGHAIGTGCPGPNGGTVPLPGRSAVTHGTTRGCSGVRIGGGEPRRAIPELAGAAPDRARHRRGGARRGGVRVATAARPVGPLRRSCGYVHARLGPGGRTRRSGERASDGARVGSTVEPVSSRARPDTATSSFVNRDGEVLVFVSLSGEGSVDVSRDHGALLRIRGARGLMGLCDAAKSQPTS